MKKLLLLSIAAVLLTAAVSAQGPRDGIRHDRIHEGFRSGQLTRPERFELRKDQGHYNNLQRRAHRDGRVTPMERRRLHHAKVHNRRETFRFKHNRHHRVL
jgi:hypothetical protein